MKTKTYKWIEDLSKDELVLLATDLYTQVKKLEKKLKQNIDKNKTIPDNPYTDDLL